MRNEIVFDQYFVIICCLVLHGYKKCDVHMCRNENITELNWQYNKLKAQNLKPQDSFGEFDPN